MRQIATIADLMLQGTLSKSGNSVEIDCDTPEIASDLFTALQSLMVAHSASPYHDALKIHLIKDDLDLIDQQVTASVKHDRERAGSKNDLGLPSAVELSLSHIADMTKRIREVLAKFPVD